MSEDGPHWRALPNSNQYVPVSRTGWIQLWTWLGVYLLVTLGVVALGIWWLQGLGALLATFVLVGFSLAAIVQLIGMIRRGL